MVLNEKTYFKLHSSCVVWKMNIFQALLTKFYYVVCITSPQPGLPQRNLHSKICKSNASEFGGILLESVGLQIDKEYGFIQYKTTWMVRGCVCQGRSWLQCICYDYAASVDLDVQGRRLNSVFHPLAYSTRLIHGHDRGKCFTSIHQQNLAMIAQRKTVVTQLLIHWSYSSLALNYHFCKAKQSWKKCV